MRRIMFIARSWRVLCRNGVAALVASAALVLGGCGGTAGPEQGTDVGDIQNDPAAGVFEDFSEVQQFVGQEVTVSAEVTEIIGPNGFTIAAENAEPLLVVYDGSAQITVDTPIQVTGTVFKTFILREAEEFAGADFDDTEFAEFDAEPYIQAAAIETDPEFGNE
jgi:hypothetical protein